ncbi:PhzF family phenazine biosynthesis protein [Psychromonas hadalis]|uniref:PhzF family phenazine biosynthesis protein n=1 Tax=Psychromonas hadalis TaxID=211669 RepID=UPI0003B38DE9|nr:PhzF family phenazine biosynthesis protein [Psychromonas hadalis]
MEMILHTISAFTDHGHGGNLAGVVLNADKLSDKQKQQIAKQAGYSETAFVCSDPQVDFSVSFFTPTAEVDFCGHATLALFYLLFEQRIVGIGDYQQRTKAGILSVTLKADGGVIMQQILPKTLARFSSEQIAPLLNLKPEKLINTLPIEVLSTGLADLFIPIPLGLLDTIKPNLPLIKKFCFEKNIIGLHLFELNAETEKVSASCRNFAPLVGIDEESATGSACGALACYLYQHLKIENSLFQQGRSMRRSSLLSASVAITDSKISNVKVGGFAKLIKREVIVL